MSHTLLLVEDQAIVRRAYAQFLRTAGYHVLEADSSTAAVEAAAGSTRPVDLVITGAYLPDGHGVELARKLMIAGVPRTILTREAAPTTGAAPGAPGLGAAPDAGDAAAARVLERPFSPEALLAEVAALLRPTCVRREPAAEGA